MAKDKIAYVCSNCGQESAKWIGKCPSCGQWNTFKEIRIAGDTGTQAARNAGMTMRHGGVATMFGGVHSDGASAPMKLRDISAMMNHVLICMMLNSIVFSVAVWCKGVSRFWVVNLVLEKVP